MTNGAAWGVLILRVVLGLIFAMHGYAGVAIFGPKGMQDVIAQMGYPPVVVPVLVWYGIIVHLVGGLCIVLGLWTRVAALLNLPIMVSALALLHWEQSFFMKGAVVDAAARRATVAGYEYSLLVLVCTVAVALIGGGPFSLDGRRHRSHRRR